MKRKIRLGVVASLLLCGGALMQFGGCITSAINGTLGAIDFCAVLGPDCALGPFSPCGDPLTVEDDFLVDCPKVAQ